MSWMDANEYLAFEQAVRDRVDEIERFSTEQVFRSETDPDEGTPAPVPPPARRAGGASRLLQTVHCLTARRPQTA